MAQVGQVVDAPPGFTKAGVAIGTHVAAPPGFNADGTPSGAAAPSAGPDVVKMLTDAGGGGLRNALHVGKGVLEALQAPQRGMAGAGQYVEQHHLGGGKIFSQPGELGAMAAQGARWFMDPKTQAATSQYDRRTLSTDNGGFIPSDAAINAHLRGFPATLARGAAQAGSEILSDPVTIAPGVGPLAKVAERLPGVTRGIEALSKSKIGESASALFNPEHHLGGLTEHGQNVVEGARNRYSQAAARAKVVEDQSISRSRNLIKGGQVPDDVKAAFAKYGATVPEGVTKPSALIKALDDARAAKASAGTRETLESIGLLEGAPNTALKIKPKPGFLPEDLFRDPAAAAEARKGVAEHIKPDAGPDNVLTRNIAKTNQQLKSMFLAVPFPHVANLSNLAYNKYGLPTTLRGLRYAAQEATGKRGAHLDALIDQLQKAGADNQYSKLFSEVNPIEPIRQIQRFANKAQDTVLNPVERGLRASMLERQLASGKTGVDAARNIHKALGSDADTGLTKGLNKLPLAQFPRFHTQTSLGSFGRTLAEKPGRIAGFQHVFGAPDRQPNGEPNFHLSTPTATGLGALQNPLGLANPSTLGGLAGILGPYSPVGLLKKGVSLDTKGKTSAAKRAYSEAAGTMVQPTIPMSETLKALYEMARKKKGEARESGVQDLINSLTGGYWSKR